MLEEEPNDPFLRYGLAMEYVSEGDNESAVRCLRLRPRKALDVEAIEQKSY